MNQQAIEQFARTIRTHTLHMVHRTNSSHVGTCFSMAELLAVLYGGALRIDPADPAWEGRDRFILSKGHGAAILYAALAERGFFPREWLDSYACDGSPLLAHASHHVPGVEVSTGSLGHGLAIGCGMALAGKRAAAEHRVVVLLSDGELDEGSNWEPILFAPQHGLDNLVAIVDYNKIQSLGSVSEVIELEPLADKWRACRWGVREIDGHDPAQIERALAELPFAAGAPSVIIAHTVKGKGVSFMEHQLAWHYKAPNREQLALALAEVAGQ
ncbi:MAG TPA: transketolase [Herpetosiphonaceae bacterium]